MQCKPNYKVEHCWKSCRFLPFQYFLFGWRVVMQCLKSSPVFVVRIWPFLVQILKRMFLPEVIVWHINHNSGWQLATHCIVCTSWTPHYLVSPGCWRIEGSTGGHQQVSVIIPFTSCQSCMEAGGPTHSHTSWPLLWKYQDERLMGHFSPLPGTEGTFGQKTA